MFELLGRVGLTPVTAAGDPGPAQRGRRGPVPAAWAVGLVLHFATSTAAEQGTRQRAIDADDEEDALVAALRDAPAGRTGT